MRVARESFIHGPYIDRKGTCSLGFRALCWKSSMPDRRFTSALVAALCVAVAASANASELPKIAIIPFGQGEGAPDKAGARFATLVADELKARDDQVEVVAAPMVKPAASAAAG